ncbi:SRPBCC family protein [Blastococcus sp. Marseille-P5729]|uniref:SRPBCC family protein n=1 Tax=Blastococcus sp. Marseille-P5729 TaxID=2086582 RepID=UPI000D0EB278|nr:SRPBCC family protein [Blastococcus sp. Marseille-P5729]
MDKRTDTLLETSIGIDASPARVWALVANPRNMARWSPHVAKVILRGAIQKGATALNINRDGAKVWPTRSKIITFDPPREYAIRVRENNAVWSFHLEPDGAGTRLTQRRDTSAGTTRLSDFLVAKIFGGKPEFDKTLLRGMNETLRKIKADAESR